MLLKTSKQKLFLIYLGSALSLFIILLLFEKNFIFSLAAIIFYAIFILGFINNKVGLLLILFIRPCLDYFTNLNFEILGINGNLAGIFAILTIIFTIFVLIKNIENLKKIPVIPAWILFLVIMLITTFFSINYLSSFNELARLLSIVLIFITSFVLINNNKDLASLIKTLIASAIIPTGVAIWQFFTKTGLTIPMEGINNRVFGTFAHPNLLAFYLLLILTLCFLVFLTSNKRKVSILLYGLLSVFFLATLGFTYTRSAWLGLLLVVLLLGITRYRFFLLVSLIFLSLSYFSFENINQRFSAFTSRDPGSSVNWRLTLWSDGISYASKKPLLGYGAGTSKELILKKRGPEAGSSDAHNDYLRILLESGFIGLSGFFILLLSLFKNIFKIYRLQTKPHLKSLAFISLILFISFAAISFGDNILANTALQWALWALWGGLLSTQKKLLNA